MRRRSLFSGVAALFAAAPAAERGFVAPPRLGRPLGRASALALANIRGERIPADFGSPFISEARQYLAASKQIAAAERRLRVLLDRSRQGLDPLAGQGSTAPAGMANRLGQTALPASPGNPKPPHSGRCLPPRDFAAFMRDRLGDQGMIP